MSFMFPFSPTIGIVAVLNLLVALQKDCIIHIAFHHTCVQTRWLFSCLRGLNMRQRGGFFFDDRIPVSTISPYFTVERGAWVPYYLEAWRKLRKYSSAFYGEIFLCLTLVKRLWGNLYCCCSISTEIRSRKWGHCNHRALQRTLNIILLRSLS